ncbi:glycosyltransferase [Oceanisphaera sp. IT1-181]|uniref:glycosyltransferase n=1 Tax=Oceanisphaera sp. IT1-181 TaxID=3081199 RepID=UPI0029CA9044|nr:glycosyltransferase [Oceanisphaera sp. IT1-181]
MSCNRPQKRHERTSVKKGTLLLWGLWALRYCCRTAFLRKKYHKIIIHLVKKTKLFDTSWYMDNNPDLQQSGISSLQHYVAYGDKEGRCPMPLFNPHFYKSRAKSKTKHINSLLHYAWIGRYFKLSPSSLFDLHYYLGQNKDVARKGMEPLYHYMKYGGLEGRSPNPQFDGSWYIQHNPEVRIARINPLIHYLQHGQYAGLPTRNGNTWQPCTTEQPVHSDNLEQLQPLVVTGEPQIDIVLPVYKDQELTLRCIASVLKAQYTTPCELIVINDASPEPELSAELQRMATKGLFTLVENSCNLGFVQTVNRGMRLHLDRDVVLLNSDTEVYGNWLDRLHKVAWRHEKNATVTPLSNNATICSYPRFLHDNPFPLETPYAVLDQLAAKHNAGLEAQAPTGVGFCMYIRRDAMQKIGLFDEQAFGKGYGEENDFCQRALQQGWRNIIAADVFVRHLGGASFQDEKANRVAHALDVLKERYPDYQQQVNTFIQHNPLMQARQNLDFARLQQYVCTENILMVCHSRGGGAERHLQEDTQYWLKQGKGVFYLRPERGRPTHVRLGHPACRQLLNQPCFELGNIKELAKILKQLRITCINTHGMVDFTEHAPLHLKELAATLSIPIHIDIHDYKVICPRINLADEQGRYCGEPDDSQCNQCLETRGNDFGVKDIRQWRENHSQILEQAEKIWVPDQDVAERLSHYYPDVTYSVAPHDSLQPTPLQTPYNRAANQALHIVVIGAIGKLKGYTVLLECARYARKHKQPLKFSVLGYTMNDTELSTYNVDVTGQYHESEALEKLSTLQPDLIWLPSTWPETYSYTLSIALQAGRPIAAFDMGAIATRLRQLDRAQHLLPLQLADSPQAVNQHFLDLTKSLSEKNQLKLQGIYETIN